MTQRSARPIVGVVIGDPAGIGPEVVVRALATGVVHQCSRPLLIGSAAAIARAMKTTGWDAPVRRISSCDQLCGDPGVVEILDSGSLDPSDLPFAEDTERAGHATAAWFDEMDRLALSGELDATVLAPISTGSLKLAGKLDKIVAPRLGETYLMLVSGPLRIVHLTDHMPLRHACEVITPELILRGICAIDHAWRRWTGERPRIAVCGLNPHATGEEEDENIAPGIRDAVQKGIDVTGPVSPDAVFRQCIEGKHDIVLAMYHDQGHIAVKTWGFSGNTVLMLGLPYLHISVAHGTAYDIVGKGIADHSMMLNAMCMAGQLAAENGFPRES